VSAVPLPVEATPVALSVTDWLIVAGYLAFALGVGIAVSRSAGSEGLAGYFQAGRRLPWWWAGTSVAATTFAADTPMAVSGIVARDGLAGNWIWLSWGLLHVAVVCLFADRWHRSRAITDAEIVSLRYSGPWAGRLRVFKAVLYGVVVNAIVLGWVIRAMASILQPYVPWQRWVPGVVSIVVSISPSHDAVWASDLVTIVALVGFVGIYSTMGGLRGVVFTDLIQFTLAMVGSVTLAWVAVDAAGGFAALSTATSKVPNTVSLAPQLLDLGAVMPVAMVVTVLYLFVQSVANNPADGGGFLMQRLGACKTARDARRAGGLFVILNYLVRPWPWFLVALSALVLIPLGQESAAFGGQVTQVAGNRELAYPALVAVLLPAGLKGVVVVSLLAAFMSTVDTHINWGASYLANDVYRALRPAASDRAKVRAARWSAVALTVLAIVSAVNIGSIETGWKTLAAIGAGLFVPTILRWLWWRVTALSELAAIAAGLCAWLVVSVVGGMDYEIELIVIAACGAAASVVAALAGAPTDSQRLDEFRRRVGSLGWWHQHGIAEWIARRSLARRGVSFVLLAAALYGGVFGVHQAMFGSLALSLALCAGCVAVGWLGWAAMRWSVREEEAFERVE
jgi:solute:Na+ symporter, SSS family